MANYNYYGCSIGNLNGEGQPSSERNFVVVQSFWTKPIKDKNKFRDMMFFAALSLEFAHRSGYKVHMHTDSKGYELLKDFGYDNIYKTLDEIPDSVPTDLFAAGKFYAMKKEGLVGKVHIDIDVFLKKKGVLDKFYTDKKVDVIVQQEEDTNVVGHHEKIYHMHILGYPTTTRPNWRGSFNTGIIGFNNRKLAQKYTKNYFDALKIYTKDVFDKYKAESGCKYLFFDFILEQITISYMSLGYNVYALLPLSYDFIKEVANALGYLHLQGDRKWGGEERSWARSKLMQFNHDLYNSASASAHKTQRML